MIFSWVEITLCDNLQLLRPLQTYDKNYAVLSQQYFDSIAIQAFYENAVIIFTLFGNGILTINRAVHHVTTDKKQ